VRAEAV